eukprot:m.1246448 g.1246448  ORF g.1246448 m.1246448 type:complete len:981 (-) comp24686_c0_seq10:422-3364(-)
MSGNEDHVVHQGYLAKKGAVNKSWKTRFFELRPHGLLTYQKHADSSTSFGQILLQGSTVSVNYATDPAGILEISSPLQKRIFYMRGNQSDIQEWHHILDVEVSKLPSMYASKLENSSEGNTRQDITAFLLQGEDLDDFSITSGEAQGGFDPFYDDDKGNNETNIVAGETHVGNSGTTTSQGPVSVDGGDVVTRRRTNTDSKAITPFYTVFKQGWMEKKGKLHKAFKRRYFVLKRGRMEYFKTDEEYSSPETRKAPRGVILVAEGSSELVAAPPESPYDFFLKISSVEGRVYVLAHRSPEELCDWLAAVRERHFDRRVGPLHAVSCSQRPNSAAIEHPPLLTKKRLMGSITSKTVLHSLVKFAKLETVCRLTCGGPECKHCDPLRVRSAGGGGAALPSAITGLNASWVTHTMVASSRPSERLIATHNIITQLHAKGISCVFNLQKESEHADCGDGLTPDGGKWSYDPQTFVDAGISCRCCGWEDFGVPTHESLLRLVREMAQEVECGGRCLVHCHAGLGRTGLLIACYLVYALNYSAGEAIALVRLRRRKSIQTRAQVHIVAGFEAYFRGLRRVFHQDPASMRTLAEEIHIQRMILSDHDIRQLKYRHHVLDAVCGRVIELAANAQHSITTDPLPDSMSTLDTMKLKMDLGDWTSILACTDTYALLELLLDWLRRFSEPILSASVVDKTVSLAEEKKDLHLALLASELNWDYSESASSGEHEALFCVLSVFQAFRRSEDVSDIELNRLAVKVAEAMMIPFHSAPSAPGSTMTSPARSARKHDGDDEDSVRFTEPERVPQREDALPLAGALTYFSSKENVTYAIFERKKPKKRESSLIRMQVAVCTPTASTIRADVESNGAADDAGGTTHDDAATTSTRGFQNLDGPHYDLASSSNILGSSTYAEINPDADFDSSSEDELSSGYAMPHKHTQITLYNIGGLSIAVCFKTVVDAWTACLHSPLLNRRRLYPHTLLISPSSDVN